MAQRCLDRLAALGPYRFDVALGESQTAHLRPLVSPDEMAAHLAALPHEANSGDVYAVLDPDETPMRLLSLLPAPLVSLVSPRPGRAISPSR